MTLILVLFTLNLIQVNAAIDNKKSFALPEVKFNDLISYASPDISNDILRMFQELGIPNMKDTRENAFKTLPNCFLGDSSLSSKIMRDGSRRLSAAAISTNGVMAEKLSSSCSIGSSSNLRYTIDSVSQSVFRALDLTNRYRDNNDNFLMYPYKTFSSLMNNGIQLEHLHTYFPNSNISNHEFSSTLDIHVDSGIMIAMTSGYYSNDLSSGMYREDLFIELPSGEVVKAKTDPDALILLAGNAANKWLSPVLGKPIRAVPHALVVSSDNVNSRSWYGKMFLPPGDAKIPGSEMTYAEVRQMELDHNSLSLASKREYNYVACGGDGSAAFELEATDCPSGQIYCWMRCQSVGSLSCGNNAVCVNTKTNEAVSGDLMCGSACSPGCLAVNPVVNGGNTSNNNNNNQYCLSPGVSMYMDGFTAMSLQQPGTVQCINFLFVTWTLDNSVKFGFACVGVFLMGVLIQALTYLRLSVASKRNKYHNIRTSLFTTTLYSFQLILSYFIMLIAMTYSVELFCMVCVGLIVGYAIFHLKMPEPISAEQCCSEETNEMIYDPEVMVAK